MTGKNFLDLLCRSLMQLFATSGLWPTGVPQMVHREGHLLVGPLGGIWAPSTSSLGCLVNCHKTDGLPCSDWGRVNAWCPLHQLPNPSPPTATSSATPGSILESNQGKGGSADQTMLASWRGEFTSSPSSFCLSRVPPGASPPSQKKIELWLVLWQFSCLASVP